jgi:hypothetical protein
MVVPGWAASNCFPSVVKAPVSEAAASTVAEPDRSLLALAEAELLGVADDVVLEDPHPTVTPAMARATTAAVAVRVGLLRGIERAPSGGKATVGYFDYDVGGFDGGDGEHSGLEPELVRGLPAHQRDNAKRSGLNLDLRHNGVAHDSRY